jgi:hypothetical protein
VPDGLRQAGWKIGAAAERRPLPEAVLRRYPWIPADVRALVESLELAVDPTDTIWILTTVAAGDPALGTWV